jgi:hypothetical protein
MVVEKATFDIQDPIKPCNAGLGEDAGKYVTNETADSMMLKDLNDEGNEMTITKSDT